MNISVSGPVNFRSYGLVCFNHLKELSRENQIALFPIGGIECPKEDQEFIMGLLHNQGSYSQNDPSVRLFHQNNIAEHPGKGKRIGYTIFETNKFRNKWPHCEENHIRQQDAICVCSKWAKGIIEQEVPNHPPIHVVPLGVDRDIFYPAPTPNNSPAYVFGNFGKIEYRKGIDVLLQCFNLAFEKTDNVKLKMVCHNPFLIKQRQDGSIVDGNKEWQNYYKSSKLGDKIEFLPWLPTQHDVANVMRSIDCAIFPSRAEGWNLEALECLSCEKPLIISNYSAHTEFCSQLNSFLIEPESMETAYDNEWFFGDVGEWLEFTPDLIEQTIEHMRYCYKNNIRSNPNGVMTAEKYTWAHSAKKLMEAIKA